MLPGPVSMKNQPIGPMAQLMGLGDQLAAQVDAQLADQAKKRLAQQQLTSKGALNPNKNGIGSVIASLLGRDSGL
jgi:hypothetical protein